MCSLSRLKSASTSSTSREPGTTWTGRMIDAQREVARRRAQDRNQVFRQHEADDVVDRVLVDRIARPPALLDQRERLVERRVDRQRVDRRCAASSPRARSSRRTRTRPRAGRRPASPARRLPGSARRACAAPRPSGRSRRTARLLAERLAARACDDELSSARERRHEPREHEERRRQPARDVAPDGPAPRRAAPARRTRRADT